MEKGFVFDISTGEMMETEFDITLPNPRILEIKTSIEKIQTRLHEIDLDSLRPLRATISGTSTDYDTEKLSTLESEASTLRTELATLNTELQSLE